MLATLNKEPKFFSKNSFTSSTEEYFSFSSALNLTPESVSKTAIDL